MSHNLHILLTRFDSWHAHAEMEVQSPWSRPEAGLQLRCFPALKVLLAADAAAAAVIAGLALPLPPVSQLRLPALQALAAAQLHQAMAVLQGCCAAARSCGADLLTPASMPVT
jgi:hypothetical protein